MTKKLCVSSVEKELYKGQVGDFDGEFYENLLLEKCTSYACFCKNKN